MCSFSCHHTLTRCSRSPLNRRFTSNITKLHTIQQQGTQNALSYFLNKCSDTLDLSSVRDLHRQTVLSRLNHVTIIGDHLIRMFSSFGSVFEANLVFCVVETPSIYTWHATIAAHLMLGEHDGALDLYSRMLHEGICTGRVTYLCILKVCGNAGAFFEGMLVHHQISSYGVDVDVVLGSTLIHMYSSCGAFDDAQCVLNHTADRNVISYNALSTGCVQHGQWFLALRIYVRMESEGIKPNKFTYTSILKACSGLGGIYEGKLIHNEIIKDGGHTDSVIVSSVVDMYAKCGWLPEACDVFGKLQEPDLRAWNAIIAGYVHHDKGLSAMACFEQMQLKGKVPDAITYSTMAKACAMTNESGLVGRIIHNMIIRAGVEGDLVVANMLIDMYARLGCLDDALKIFNTLSQARDIVSWGALIAGYIQQGHDLLAVEAFEKMQREGLKLSKALFLTILKACSCLSSLKRVKLLHEQIKKVDAELDATIGSALVDTYSKCGDIKEAHAVFGDIKSPDAVCWNAIITGYVQNGLGLMSLDLFEKMQFEGVEPDTTTLSSTLKACGCIGAVRQGRLIHHKVAESGAIVDSVLDNTLVNMYAGCGALEDARILLNGLADQNVGSWGALIAGYAQYGECIMAEKCFNKMLQQGIKPDGKVFTSMLAVCSHAGHVAEAHYFQCMQTTHCITPDLQHFNCMIDLLASMGRLKEAKGLIEIMPVQPDVTGWMSLLAACRRYGNVSLGRQCFDGVFRMDASIAASYMLMSNIFADKNLLHDMQKTLELQRKEGACKKPATCWIEIEHKIWEFVVGGKGCKDYNGKANRLKRNMLQDIAYLPHLDLVFESILGGVDGFYPSKTSQVGSAL